MTCLNAENYFVNRNRYDEELSRPKQQPAAGSGGPAPKAKAKGKGKGKAKAKAKVKAKAKAAPGESKGFFKNLMENITKPQVQPIKIKCLTVKELFGKILCQLHFVNLNLCCIAAATRAAETQAKSEGSCGQAGPQNRCESKGEKRSKGSSCEGEGESEGEAERLGWLPQAGEVAA